MKCNSKTSYRAISQWFIATCWFVVAKTSHHSQVWHLSRDRWAMCSDAMLQKTVTSTDRHPFWGKTGGWVLTLVTILKIVQYDSRYRIVRFVKSYITICRIQSLDFENRIVRFSASYYYTLLIKIFRRRCYTFNRFRRYLPKPPKVSSEKV